jgi:very-short-patch-repair endonuclease
MCDCTGELHEAAKSCPSAPELAFLRLVKAAGLPEPWKEYKFAQVEGRMWRFDFAWLDHKVAVEIEGATWSGGRHTRGAGYASDCEKYNAAVRLGWSVLRFTTTMLKDQQAVTDLVRVMLGRWKIAEAA